MIEPKEGQRRRLCSNSVSNRCPSLGFYPNSELVTDEMLVDYLANILADIFIAQKTYECTNKQTSGDLLPRINKRTS